MSSTPGAFLRYGVAAAAVAIALAVRLALNPVLGAHSPYLPFALAVVVAARFGGRWPGFAATALSGFSVAWFFIAPGGSLAIADPAAFWGLALFAVVGSLISLVAGRLQESLVLTERAEQALRQQSELVDLAHDAIITMDSGRRIVRWNAGAQEMYGWAEQEVVGNSIHELLQTSGGTPTSEIDGILGRMGQWNGELHHIARDGRTLVVDSRQVRIRGESSLATGILEINRDVTERNRAETALRASEDRLRLAQRVASIGTFEWNIQTGVNQWTPELEAMYGLPPGGFTGTQNAWEELVRPDDRAEAVRRVSEALEKGSFEAEWRVIWPDGTLHWLFGKAFVFNDESGKPLRLIGVNIDITDRKQAEESLRESEMHYRTLFNSIDEGFCIVEVIFDESEKPVDYRFLEVSPSFEKQTGLADAQGKRMRELAEKTEDYWFQIYGEIALTGRPARFQNRAEQLGRWYDVYAFRFGAPEKRHVAVLFNDITGRKQADERLRQMQKMESIGVLAGGVAHDFNNLLTVIMGSASCALAECPSCGHSQAILAASERAAYLTKQLLAYAGKGQFLTKTFVLTDLVEKSTPILSASVPKRVSLKFNLSQNLPPIEADPSRVEQILMNLVINAAESIPPKTDGWIEITTGSCKITTEIAFRHAPAFDVETGEHVFLEVSDSGAGMDEATMSRIFDPFFSTKFTGRGLGLAAVHGIVRSSKGFIEVRSFPGTGSTFRVCLPACQKNSSTDGSARAQPAVPRRELMGSSTVLVVDDEEMVRQLACMMLRRYGYDVLEAKDGKDALRVLAGADPLPALALVDLAMPVMGGDELLPILERKYPGLKIVVHSGFPEEDARKGFTASSAVSFLQKPFTVVGLLEKVRESIGAIGPAPGIRVPRKE